MNYYHISISLCFSMGYHYKVVSLIILLVNKHKNANFLNDNEMIDQFYTGKNEDLLSICLTKNPDNKELD